MARDKPPEDLAASLGYLPDPASLEWLDPTASLYMGDARYLFASLIELCGYPTAKFIFEKCIKEGAEIEAERGNARSKQAARALAPVLELPSIAKIDGMDREEVCRWYARFARTDQAYDERAHRLLDRYLSFGGQPKDFNSNVPPIKRKGARTRTPVNAELPALFDSLKAAHGGKLTNERVAELVIKERGRKHGPNVEAVLRNLRTQKKKRKV